MNKRPGHVVVTTEVAVCTFCGRPRTLRTEQHQLGTLVRTIVTCETCHRTLSSSMGVASAEAAAGEPAVMEPKPAQETSGTAPAGEPDLVKPAAKPAARRKPTAAAAKSTASKSKTNKKTR